MSSVVSEGQSSVQSGGLSTPERGLSPSLRPMYNQLGRDLERMREDRCTTDVVLTSATWGEDVDGVHVHSFILIARCEKYWGTRKEMTAKVRKQCPLVVPLSGRFSIAALKRAVHYLYTGELELHNADLLGLLEVCQELGLPRLQAACLEYLSLSLEASTVCPLLGEVDALIGSPSDHPNAAFSSVRDACMQFIERRAREVVRTESFLKLPKEALICVVRSDKMDLRGLKSLSYTKRLRYPLDIVFVFDLCLPEEDVWRSVLRWGCHRVGCSQQAGERSDQEREKLKLELHDVLVHLRLMQISSTFFAQEVEPTGLLTVEQTLDRYRMAALPEMQQQQGPGSSLLTKPRGTTDFFADSDILASQPQLQRLLNEWYGAEDQEWVLLYRASRDGYRAKDFHRYCDAQGATIIIVKDTSGNTFGGYTDISWTSKFRKGRYMASNSAFLFTLKENSPTKLDVKQSSYAVQSHPGCGPIFGAGADLYISSECNMNKDSYSNLLHSYGSPHGSVLSLASSYSFQIEDYEVFKPAITRPHSTAI